MRVLRARPAVIGLKILDVYVSTRGLQIQYRSAAVYRPLDSVALDLPLNPHGEIRANAAAASAGVQIEGLLLRQLCRNAPAGRAKACIILDAVGKARVYAAPRCLRLQRTVNVCRSYGSARGFQVRRPAY